MHNTRSEGAIETVGATGDVRAEMHPVRRARERYGLKLTALDLVKLAWACRNDGRYLRDGSDGTEVLTVDWRGRELIVAYCRRDNRVRTFLPPGQQEEARACAAPGCPRAAMESQVKCKPCLVAELRARGDYAGAREVLGRARRHG